MPKVGCVVALERALERGKPEIFNTDQGCQFTSKAFLAPLKDRQIRISMDGKGRAFDNIFIERFWRTLKYEWLYANSFEQVSDLSRGLRKYLCFYNSERLHSSLQYRTPEEIHFENCGSRETTLAMVFKLVQSAEKRWKRIKGFNLIGEVITGVVFRDGLRVFVGSVQWESRLTGFIHQI